jgi:uroporphyrinogen-III decarboxylase
MIAPFVAPGLFEQCHYLMEIQNCLMAFYEYPDEMHELIDYITDWEVEYAKEICKYLKPDALFHHDDWGSGASSFLSPEMFEEFFVPGYKRIYDTYREGGVQIIIHHSDSYAANLVPSMIKMGIDVWQGVMTSNNIPELIEKYGDKITFMGGIDSATVDHVDWSREQIASEVERAAREYGRKAFIPCNTMGDPGCLYEGVNVTLNDEIEKLNQRIIAEGGF